MNWKYSLPLLILIILVAGSLVVNQDEEITLYGRRSSSGTFVYFRNNVIEDEYSGQMYNMIGNESIIQAIKNDKTGIGYVGVGYVLRDNGDIREGIKILNIAKGENYKPASPLDPKNVKEGKYPIARPLYQYINNNSSKKSSILDFIKFELSEEKENLIIDTGFYPVIPSDRQQNEKNLENTEDGATVKNLEIKGSDTELQLVSNFAEAYLEKHPDSKITVEGGGSGTGIAALISERTDIANSSRKMKEKEIEEAESNGIDPTEFIIARDCITIIVNENNPVENLTMKEVSKIFSGEITKWTQLEGWE